MTRQIIIVDCETNGLDLVKHEAVEVAWANLDTDEGGCFIPKHDVQKVLGAADVKALQINRYIDRIADQPQANGVDDPRSALWHALEGNTLAGSNPAFDAAMLTKMFSGFRGNPTPWHYRLFDLSAYAAGVLGLDELPGLALVCELLGVRAPDHTAAGDVAATARCFEILREGKCEISG